MKEHAGPPLAFERKLYSWSEKGLAAAPLPPRPWVLTNGCFDILHRGHVSYLAEAKELGRTLIVAVNTDDSVRRQNKGFDEADKRPINALEDRMLLLAALESTDVILSFDEDTPLALVDALKPDILVKGGDYTLDSIIGAKEVMGWGGEVYSIKVRVNRSTTALVRKLRNTE
jgi:rfaE bifunctional protein nucleotidyltransferase chain/domain